MLSGHLYQLNKNNALNRKFQRKTKQKTKLAISNFFFQKFFLFKIKGLHHTFPRSHYPRPLVSHRTKNYPLPNLNALLVQIKRTYVKTKNAPVRKTKNEMKRKTKKHSGKRHKEKKKENALYYNIYIIIIILHNSILELIFYYSM